MESSAAAVVRICGYPTNPPFAQAFVIFQTLRRSIVSTLRIVQAC